MPTIAERSVSILLKAIRTRRLSPDEDTPASAVKPSDGANGVRLRELSFDDFDAVARLRDLLRWRWAPDSVDNWHRLWRNSPAIRSAKSSLPMGWVLEADKKIVGYLGNIPLLYHFGDRPLLAAAASGFLVEPAYRTFGKDLVASFYSQPNIDLFLSTTVESVGRLAKALEVKTLPQENYSTVLFWVLDAQHFADAVVWTLGATGAVRSLGGRLGSLALRADTTARRRRPVHSSSKFQITEILVSEIGDDFEELWRRKLAERPRLLADRDPATLRWHFTLPGSRKDTNVFCCESRGRLVGYAIFRRETDAPGLRRCCLIDLIVEGDDAEIVSCLVARGYQLAMDYGCHTFEALGFPKFVRQVLLEGNPYSRDYPACPYCFKASDRVLHETLKHPESWYACGLDGDTSLMP
jgi:hypothetical protein